MILKPTPSTNDNYFWIPEVSYNVVPGFGSILVYSRSKFPTLTSLQNAITIISNIIQNETNNLELPNQGIVNASKQLCHRNSFADYIFQRNNTIHTYGNRRTFIILQQHFTYQIKGHAELQIQFLNIVIADLQNKHNKIHNNIPHEIDGPDMGYA